MFEYRVNKTSQLPEDMRMIYIYRYVSLFITSVFYLFSKNSSSTGMKFFMTLCLTISAIIFNYLYVLYEQAGKLLILFIFIEVVGNTFILVPTGGIHSPYIWYSLNSIFITGYFFNIYVSLIVLLIYQSLSSFLAQLIFHNDKLSLTRVFTNNSSLLLSFILIIIVVQLFLKQAKRLSARSRELFELNSELNTTNNRLKDSMDQLMNLYETVYSINTLASKDKLIDLMLDHTRRITKSPFIMLDTIDKNKKWSAKSSGETQTEDSDRLADEIRMNTDEIKNSTNPLMLRIGSENLMIMPISSNTKLYGILSIEYKHSFNEEIHKETVNQMRFLASLCAISFEKLELEPIRYQMLINEEQNRIANDIHDSVSQRLFALSCGIFSLIRKSDDKVPKPVAEELRSIQQSLNTAIKELRETIYGMSWNKQGMSVFKNNIKKYIEDISKLYGIDILFNVDGSEELIGSIEKKAIYRVICEGVGNSARHGKSKHIKVDLNIERNCTYLTIADDGTGFQMSKNKEGMGLKNMNNLIYAMNGKLEISTKVDQGTIIKITLPNDMEGIGVRGII